MPKLTKTHIAILEALATQTAPVRPDDLANLPVKGKTRDKQIIHLAEQGLLVQAEDGVSLTDIGRAALATPETPAEAAAAKKPRKKDQLIALLKAEQGTTVPDLAAALDWLPHTTRAALTGLKKAGHEIDKLPPLEGSRSSRYKLVEPA